MRKFSLYLLILSVLTFLLSKAALAQNATDSGGAIREKVLERIQTKLRSPRAYIGVVTDIIDSTFMIKSASGEVRQASVDKERTVVVKVGKTSKEVSFKELAIGDFVIAMGYKNGNDVLETKRILVTQAFEPSKITSYFVIVTEVNKNQLTVERLDKSQGPLTVETTKSHKVTSGFGEEVSTKKFSDIKRGNKLIVVGIPNGNIIEARRIHLLSSSQTPSPTPTTKPQSGQTQPPNLPLKSLTDKSAFSKHTTGLISC